MRFFIVVTCLIACIYAAPQYGYQTNDGGHRGGDKYLPPASTTPAPLVHKQFYVISAPEDNDGAARTKHLVLGRPQRNYRVVFIKAPVGDNNNVKYSAELAPQEEKTVIYVLSKKDNDLDANDIATPAPTLPSKPEVFFIKYKTDEEAKQAQKEIQGQYDKLGGTNDFSDEGTAPITSIVGSLDGLNPDGSYNYRPINNAGNSDLSNQISPAQASAPVATSIPVPSPNYLPSVFRY